MFMCQEDRGTHIQPNGAIMERARMQRRAHLTILALMLSCQLCSLALSAPNHSLYWAVEADEEFTYALQRYLVTDESIWKDIAFDTLPFGSSIGEGKKIVARVTGLETVPEQINVTTDVPNSFCSVMRENDSVQLWSNLTLFVVPVGDWELLTNMSGLISEGATLIDDEHEWGASRNGAFTRNGVTVTFSYEIRWEKTNGTLSYIRHRYSASGNDLLDIVFVQWHPGMPTILPPELQLSTVLTALLAVGVVSVVSVLVYKKYTSRRPIVRRLGE